MVKEEQILLYLHNDAWFRPSKSDRTKPIHDENGNIIEVVQSYYHDFINGGQIAIRVSEHGTSLQTWVKRRLDPTQSLQNLSVVFSDKPIISNVTTEPIEIANRNGNMVKKNVYFVVEQYAYNTTKLSFKDFKKIISRIKSLDRNTVFSDPFRKKPSKLANRSVLTPSDINGNKVAQNANVVHKRQTMVANNPNKEINAQGQILEKRKVQKEIIVSEPKLSTIIRKIIKEIAFYF